MANPDDGLWIQAILHHGPAVSQAITNILGETDPLSLISPGSGGTDKCANLFPCIPNFNLDQRSESTSLFPIVLPSFSLTGRFFADEAVCGGRAGVGFQTSHLHPLQVGTES